MVMYLNMNMILAKKLNLSINLIKKGKSKNDITQHQVI